MELETQVQVSTNQLRRQDEENKKLKESLEMAVNREREMSNKAREQQHRFLYPKQAIISYNYINIFKQIFRSRIAHER